MNKNILGQVSGDVGDITKAWFLELRILKHTTWKLEQRGENFKRVEENFI